MRTIPILAAVTMLVAATTSSTDGTQLASAAAQARPAPLMVPQGNGVPVITEGIFTPGEWDDALRVTPADGITLYLKEYRGVVFVGIRGSATAMVGPSELSLSSAPGSIQKLHVSFALAQIDVPPSGTEPKMRLGYTTDWYANEFRHDEDERARLVKEGKKSPPEVMQATSYPSEGIEFAIRRSKFPGDAWSMRASISAFVNGKPSALTYPPAAADRTTDGWLELRFK
jgi:hypothetical protein